MPGYVVANYTITDAEGYEPYVPGSVPTIQAAGGEILVADFESDKPEGEAGHVTIVVRFDSKQAAQAWYDSAEYGAVKSLRTDHSEGVLTIAEEFVAPTE